MYRWIILLILCSRCGQSSELECNIQQYEQDGTCCSLCSPGQWLYRDCTKHNDTVCKPCSHGEYQDKFHRETSCLLHRECNEQLGFEIIRNGTTISNVICSCQRGRHCSSEACETCVVNTACGPGKGVVRRATSVSDTCCLPCYEGTYSNTESDTEPCKNWSKCGNGEKILEPGTSTTDVVCGPRPPDHQSITWVIVLVIMVLLVVVVLPLVLYFSRSYRKNKKKTIQEQLEDNKEQQLLKPADNLPEEDQDDQDITMQGLPVAQEQGKDCHMSQEEV